MFTTSQAIRDIMRFSKKNECLTCKKRKDALLKVLKDTNMTFLQLRFPGSVKIYIFVVWIILVLCLKRKLGMTFLQKNHAN